MRHWLIVVGLWGGACGGDPRPEAMVDAVPLTLTLERQRYTIELPAGARATPSQAGGVRIELRPGARAPDAITLGPTAPGGESYPSEAVLEGVGWMRYQTERSTGGSGGDEVSLRGVLQLPSGRYDVACHRQAEGDPGPATWCLAPLGTLRRVE